MTRFLPRIKQHVTISARMAYSIAEIPENAEAERSIKACCPHVHFRIIFLAGSGFLVA